MKILYVHQYFKTPQEPGGTRSYWIARKMIERGHEVIMLTSKDIKDNKLYTEIDGIKVIYLNVNYTQQMSIFRRLSSFTKFMIKSCIVAYKNRNKFDKVFATSTPLSIGVIALYCHYFLNKKYLFEVRDLWPEVPIQMGAIKNPVIIKILKTLERLIYNKSEKIIALSPGMSEGVLKLCKEKGKVYMIPNMSKPDLFYKRKKNPETYNKYKLKKDTINIIYFGAIGKSNGLLKVVDFFGKLEHLSGIELIIAGEGSEKKVIEQRIKESNLNNIKVLGNYPSATISEIVNCCDVCLVSFADFPILATNSPNKLFDSLSAGKPIIVNSNGWTKELVEKNKCGFYYDYNNFDSFKEMIKIIKKKKGQLETMGDNSFQLCKDQYDKELLTNKIVDLL